MFYTVRSAALDLKRGKNTLAKHIVYTDFQEEENYMSLILSPQDIVERREIRENLVKHWGTLSENDREPLYRKYVLQETNEEIAEAINCKSDSIRMKLTRAKRRALQIAKKEGV